MNILNDYFSANYRERSIIASGRGSFPETCTVGWAEEKEKESQERDCQPQSYKALLERQAGLEELARDDFLDK